MSDELTRYLDGEITRDELPPELRARADYWDEVLDAAAALRDERAPAWIEGRVMLSLPDQRPGVIGWLLRPRTLRVRPLTAGLLATAAIAALVILWPTAEHRPGGAPAEPAVAGQAAARIYIQFVHAAPGASSVSVAGDFNDWRDSTHPLRDPDGDGTWSAVVPVEPGLHKYMFVVDGQWETDPRAERHIDDGFGMENALLTVAPPVIES